MAFRAFRQCACAGDALVTRGNQGQEDPQNRATSGTQSHPLTDVKFSAVGAGSENIGGAAGGFRFVPVVRIGGYGAVTR